LSGMVLSYALLAMAIMSSIFMGALYHKVTGESNWNK